MASPTQTKFTGIRAVHEALKLGGYLNKLKPFEPSKPFQYIVVKPRPFIQSLSEKEDRTYAMNIMFHNDALQAKGIPELPLSNTLIFSIYMPFRFYLETMGESAFVISTFNNLIPHGKIGVNSDYLPFFTYHLKTSEPYVSSLVVMEIMESMLFFMDRLAGPLEAVANKQLTVLEGIQAAELAIGTPPTKNS